MQRGDNITVDLLRCGISLRPCHSGHSRASKRCLLYPQKRTLKLSRVMSALCQRRTSRIRSARALSPASSPNVDKAAVRDRRKLFVVAPAAAPAADAAVAAVVAGAAAPAAGAAVVAGAAAAAADAAVAAVVAAAAAPAADAAVAAAVAAPAAAASVAAVAAGAAAPAADGSVALVDVAVWRPRDHLARRARVVLGRPVKAGPAAAAGAERAFGQARQAQVAELWSPSAVLREAAPARWQRREQSRVNLATCHGPTPRGRPAARQIHRSALCAKTPSLPAKQQEAASAA